MPEPQNDPQGWKTQAKFGLKVLAPQEEGLNHPTGSREGYETPDAPADKGLYSGRYPDKKRNLES
jgi:hypothetical protein